MKEKAQAFVMWALAVPVTAAGFKTLAQVATTLFGMLTAFVGFLIGVCGLLWWIRRLRRQEIKLQMDELELKNMQRHPRHHPAREEE